MLVYSGILLPGQLCVTSGAASCQNVPARSVTGLAGDLEPNHPTQLIPARSHLSASAFTIRSPLPPVSTPRSPLSWGMQGSDELPRSAISTRVVYPDAVTVKSKQPPSPDAVCRTALEAISLTMTSTSSMAGHWAPRMARTKSRACPTAAASPGNQSAAATSNRSACTAIAIASTAVSPGGSHKAPVHDPHDHRPARADQLPAPAGPAHPRSRTFRLLPN